MRITISKKELLISVRSNEKCTFIIAGIFFEGIELNIDIAAHYAATERKTFKLSKWIFIIHYLMYPGQEVFGATSSYLYAIILGNFDVVRWKLWRKRFMLFHKHAGKFQRIFELFCWFVARSYIDFLHLIRTPFHRSMLKGYLLYVFFEGNIEVAFVSSHISCWTMFVGFYLYFVAFINDLNTIFDLIDEESKWNKFSKIGSLYQEAIEFQTRIFK